MSEPLTDDELAKIEADVENGAASYDARDGFRHRADEYVPRLCADLRRARAEVKAMREKRDEYWDCYQSCVREIDQLRKGLRELSEHATAQRSQGHRSRVSNGRATGVSARKGVPPMSEPEVRVGQVWRERGRGGREVTVSSLFVEYGKPCAYVRGQRGSTIRIDRLVRLFTLVAPAPAGGERG